ncbi:MAG TPA: CopG family antitoxin, partial [Thermoanaerobaculia bacterium]|nr:CopG family antitoxin [Thermoanaerobaculia bacterium]
PIPARFASIAEAAEFWDTHDLADYADQTQETVADVKLGRRTFFTALEPDLAKRVSAYAAKQGVKTETLINVWLSEKLAAATSGK